MADVMVISRELMFVKLTGIDPKLTNPCVMLYVATPAGISNPLTIPLQPGCAGMCTPKPSGTAQSPFACDKKFTAHPLVATVRQFNNSWQVVTPIGDATFPSRIPRASSPRRWSTIRAAQEMVDRRRLSVDSRGELRLIRAEPLRRFSRPQAPTRRSSN